MYVSFKKNRRTGEGRTTAKCARCIIVSGQESNHDGKEEKYFSQVGATPYNPIITGNFKSNDIFTSNSMEPTLTAFVSKDSDETNTYKSGDKVNIDGIVKGTGQLIYNGWSIYDENTDNTMVLNPQSLIDKRITITPLETPPMDTSIQDHSNRGYNSYPTSANGWGGYGGRSRKSRKSKSRKSRKSRK